MAKLVFKVAADYDKVIKLREEIDKLKTSMKNFDGSKSEFEQMGKRMNECQREMSSLTQKAAQAGVAFDNDLKRKIFNASQGVNDFTEKIIKQKAVVKDVEADVRKLSNAYREALRSNPMKASGLLEELTSARKVLDDEKAALFGLTQQQAEARLSVKKLRDEYSLYSKDVSDSTESTDLFGASLGKTFVAIGGTYVLKELASNIVKVRGEFESMQMAIETMVGKDTAAPLLAQIKELAKISPLTMQDMVGAEKMMLGFNIQAEDTIKYLKAMSDLSMGDGAKFNSLTLAFSQMSAAGKLMGQDLLQMINAGFNPLTTMAEKTGKSVAQLKEDMSKGAISAQMVQQAFIDATSAGGKFYNMSANGAKTINGQISMMRDAMDAAFNKIGEQSQGLIMKSIQGVTGLIENYETVGKVIVGLVATYGAYRTAVMLVTAAESKHTLVEIALTRARVLARKAQMALNASMLTNPYVALAVAVGGLVTTIWALSDSETAAEKAQKKYNEEKEIAIKKEKEHKDRIDELLDSARDESLATLTRQRSLDALKNEYPKIFAQYDIERLKLADILKLKQKINEIEVQKSIEGRRKEYQSINEKIEGKKWAINLAQKLNNRSEEEQYKKELQQLYEERALKEKDVLSDSLDDYKIKITKYSKDKLEIELNALKQARKEGKRINVNGLSMAGSRLDSFISALSTESSKRDTKKTTFSEDIQKAKDEWDAAKKELAKIIKDKSKFTTEQYEKAKKAEEDAKKKYSDLGGDTKGYSKDVEAKAKAEREAKAREEEKALKERQAAELKEQEELQKVLEKYQGYVDKRKSIEDKYNADRKKLIENGASQAFLDENEYQKQETLKAIDEEFAARDDKFEDWADTLTDKTLEKLRELLKLAKEELDKIETENPLNPQLAVARAKVYKLDEQIKGYGKGHKNELSPDEKSLKKWQELRKTLVSVGKEFDTIGKEIGGTAGAFISAAGQVATSTLSMIDGIKTVTYGTVMAMDETGKMASRAMTTIEKASVILSVISAALQVFTKLSEAFQDSYQQYEAYANKIKEINALTDAVNQYRIAALEAQQAESKWFSEDSLQSLRDYKKVHDEVAKAYGDKAFEAQAVYENKGGGGWLTKLWSPITHFIDATLGQIWGVTINKTYEKGTVAAIDNLRIETRKKSSGFLGTGIGGKSQKTEELSSWARSQGLGELFDEKGLINKELAQSIIDNYSEKLVGQTKETLEALIKLREQYDEYVNELHEYVSSLYEPLVTNFVDSIWDWLADGKDALKQFKEYAGDVFKDIAQDMVKTMVLKYIFGEGENSYQNKINKVYEDYAAGMIDEVALNNKVTDLTQELLNNAETQLPTIENIAGNLANAYSKLGIDITGKSSSSSQDSSSKGFNTMSQETGEELNGRFTSMNEEEIKQNQALIILNTTANDIKGINSGIKDIAGDVQRMLADSYLELKQISDNTGAIVKPIRQMCDDIAEIKRNTK